MDFPQKVFCGVFKLPLLRNAQNRRKKKSKKEKKRKVPTHPIYLQQLPANCEIHVVRCFQLENK
jgi:hypothetical protein